MPHAVLSPSSAHRWLACPPSARLEELFPDRSSAAAAEGTVAHALGEAEIRLGAGITTSSEYDVEVAKVAESEFYCPDMVEYVSSYRDYVLTKYEEAKRCGFAHLAIEERIDLKGYVPGGFGTADCVIIADGVMNVIDLKYGKGVMVSAEDNPQAKLYALGSYLAFGMVFDIEHVQVTIFQPRLNNVSVFDVSIEELLDWAEKELKPQALKAYVGSGSFAAGDHCGFCRAKSVCRANAEMQLEIEDYHAKAVLSDEEMAEILSRADGLKKWVNGIEAYALEEAVANGKRWPGFKLVEGRSVRVYSDQDKVAKTLVENEIPEAIIYERKLLGITAMEKAITKKRFTELLGGLIVKPQGKPTLVPASDKRPEIGGVASAIEDFS